MSWIELAIKLVGGLVALIGAPLVILNTLKARRKQKILPPRSMDLITGPLTISAVLKGGNDRTINDAYPVRDSGVHFVFSLFNGNAFDFLIHEIDVEVLSWAPLDLDHLAHGVGATDVRRYFRAMIRPKPNRYRAAYENESRREFVRILPDASEAFDVEITASGEGIYDVRLCVRGGAAGEKFDFPVDSTRREIAFFDSEAGYMVDRGLGIGAKMLSYSEYSQEMKSYGLKGY